MLVGIIDIGSNTVRLTIYDADPATGDFSVKLKFKENVGLVAYLDRKKTMGDEGIRRLKGVLKGYLDLCAAFDGLAGPYAFATAGIRNAANSADVIGAMRKDLGIKVDLLSGKDEAKLGCLGAMWGDPMDEGGQVDVGGGSTEVSVIGRGTVIACTSLPYGSLNLFDTRIRDMIPTHREADQIAADIRDALADVGELAGKVVRRMTGTGGTIRALRVMGEPFLGRTGTTFARDDIATVIERSLYDPHAAERELLRHVPERVHTFVPGMIITATVMEALGADEIRIRECGIREGYLLGRVLPAIRDGKAGGE